MMRLSTTGTDFEIESPMSRAMRRADLFSKRTCPCMYLVGHIAQTSCSKIKEDQELWLESNSGILSKMGIVTLRGPVQVESNIPLPRISNLPSHARKTKE